MSSMLLFSMVGMTGVQILVMAFIVLELTILGGMGKFDEAVQLACSTGQRSREEPRRHRRCFAFDSGVYVGGVGSCMLGMVHLLTKHLRE
jgi:hypothetical protein